MSAQIHSDLTWANHGILLKHFLFYAAVQPIMLIFQHQENIEWCNSARLLQSTHNNSKPHKLNISYLKVFINPPKYLIFFIQIYLHISKCMPFKNQTFCENFIFILYTKIHTIITEKAL